MSDRAQGWLTDPRSEPELSWMIGLSAIVHLVAAIVVIALPGQIFVRTPPPAIAYTVKIVDTSALGGRLTKGEPTAEAEPAGVRNPAPKEEVKAAPKPEPEPPKPVE